MNHRKSHLFSRLELLIIIAASALIGLGGAQRAHADEPLHWATVTNAPDAALLTLNNQTKTSTASVVINVPPDQDLYFEVSQSAASGTVNTVIGFDTTCDTGTFTTTQPIKLVTALNGSTTAIVPGVIYRTNLVGVTAIKWTLSQTTNAAATTINYVKVGWLQGTRQSMHLQ